MFHLKELKPLFIRFFVAFIQKLMKIKPLPPTPKQFERLLGGNYVFSSPVLFPRT